jgi:hypothetical protein
LSGSKKLVLSDACIPKIPFSVPSDQQHGEEGSKEGSPKTMTAMKAKKA